jgi:hypothetical protein
LNARRGSGWSWYLDFFPLKRLSGLSIAVHVKGRSTVRACSCTHRFNSNSEKSVSLAAAIAVEVERSSLSQDKSGMLKGMSKATEVSVEIETMDYDQGLCSTKR